MRGLRSQQRLPASAVYHGAARSQKQTRKPPRQAGGSSPEGRAASALGGSAGERTSSRLRGPMSSGGQPKAARVRRERARLGAPHAERGRAGPSGRCEAPHIRVAGRAKQAWRPASAAQRLGEAGQPDESFLLRRSLWGAPRPPLPASFQSSGPIH